MQLTAAGGAADGLFPVRFRSPFRQHQHIPGVGTLGKRHQRQILRGLHGHVLQGVNGEIHLSLPQGQVQLLHKEALAADLVQGPVQNPVAGGLHGHQFQLRLGISRLNGVHHHPALNHRKPALPAAKTNCHFSSSNTFRISRAARAVRWWSLPVDTTPATRFSPVQMAGK